MPSSLNLMTVLIDNAPFCIAAFGKSYLALPLLTKNNDQSWEGSWLILKKS
jgi:hypothetical protein